MKELKMSESFFIEQTINCSFRSLDKVLCNNIKPNITKVVPNWEELSDEELLNSFPLNQYLEGTIYLINFASYIDDLVFELAVTDLSNLPYIYPNKYQGGVFNGDTTFVSLDSMNLIYFHHEGVWFLYKIPLLSE